MIILTPKHILITFVFGEKSKGISNIQHRPYSTFKTNKNEVCPFSDRQEPHLNIYTIDLAIVFE